jgi:hypothetical protein
MRSKESFASFIERKRAEYGEKFDPSALEPVFIPYFESQARIEVVTKYPEGEAYKRRGRVGVTTGWRPTFLLMHRISDVGSGDVLGPNDKVVKEIAP